MLKGLSFIALFFVFSVQAMKKDHLKFLELSSKWFKEENKNPQKQELQRMEMSEYERHLTRLELEPEEFKETVEEAANENFINFPDEHGKTILRNAIYLGKPEHIKILCSHKADPFVSGHYGEHAFHDVARLGDLATLRLLLRYHSSNPIWESIRNDHNAQERAVNSPLFYAQKNGHDVCAFVLKNFHKYNKPITKAIIFGDIDALKEHLEKRDISEIIDRPITGNYTRNNLTGYCTPLTFAILVQDYEMVKYLLENGARDPGTFLTKYLAKDIPNEIKKLLKKYNIQLLPFKQYQLKNCKQMALSNAVLSEFKPKVTKALKSGATINGFDHKGNTALHWACTIGSPVMIDLLLQLGGDPNIVDRDKQRTGLHWLLRMHKQSVKKHEAQIATSILFPCLFLLVSAGADPNIKDDQGKTFLDWLTEKFKDDHKELAHRILEVRSLSSAERIKLLENIFDFQMHQMNKWHLKSKSFDLRDVAHIKAVCVKKSGQNSDFKDIYKKYTS